MMRILSLMMGLLCLLTSTAMADGTGEWLHSSTYGWTRLAAYAGEYDGYVCVDGLGGVTLADEVTVTVISKSASVWSEPRTNSKKLSSAAHGTGLWCRVDDQGSPILQNGFYAVELDGRDGWINAAYVVRNDLTITLLESNVPAYIAPDTASKKVGSLSKMTKYRVIGFYDDFYIVNLRDAAAAYIPMNVRHRDNTFDRNYHGGGGNRRTATANWKLSLRTGPGSDYPEIRTLKAGTQLTVYDVIDDWYLVSDPQTGEWAFLEPGSLDLQL